MAGYSLPLSRWFLNGVPATNCQVTVYQTGTTTKVALFSDNALTSPLANPLSGNISGEVTFYVGSSVALRVVVTTSGGTPVADLDPVFPVSNLAGFSGTGADLNKIAGITDGTATAGKALVTDSTNSVGGLTTIGTTEGNISPYATDKNLLTGGDFSTNPWQQATSFPAVASGTYTADQWLYRKAGTMVHTVSRDTDVPTVAQAGRYVSHSLRLALTTPQASLGVSDYCALVQPVEGSIFLPAAQSTFILSFWVKATLPGTYAVSFRNGGGDRAYVAEYAVVTAATWERKVVTATPSPAAGTWNYGTGTGLEACFTLAAGANLQAAAGAWQAGSYYAPPGQVNGVQAAAADFRLALVQLEKGPAATAFDSRSVQAELARCQRYLPSFTAEATNTPVCPGQAVTTVTARCQFPFVVTPRVRPTGVTVSSAAAFGVYNAAATIVPATAVAFVNASKAACNFDVSVAAGLAAGNATQLITNAASGSLLFTGCQL